MSRWFLPMSNQSSDNSANIMCHMQEYPPLDGCNAEMVWGHNVCWRAWPRSGYSISVFCPYQHCSRVLLEENNFYFSPHCSRSRYSSHALCGSTTIADSCPWIITMLLMCVSFYDIFLWVNTQYSVNVFDICYVRLHIGASVGQTMHHNGGLFDSSCFNSRCVWDSCLPCSRSHQS